MTSEQLSFLRRYSQWKKKRQSESEETKKSAVAYAAIDEASDKSSKEKEMCFLDPGCSACLADPSWNCALVHSYVRESIYGNDCAYESNDG